jgi:hypothetical protein
VAQAHLPGTWIADFDIFIAQNLWGAGVMEANSFRHQYLASSVTPKARDAPR